MSTPTGLKSIGVTMLPFTPVTFDGPDAIYAWTRLIVYGAASTLMWKRHRPTAYLFAGAAGLSLLTSLSGSAYPKPVVYTDTSTTAAPVSDQGSVTKGFTIPLTPSRG